MFPFEDEEPRTWSEYGAVLKPDEFRKKKSESCCACNLKRLIHGNPMHITLCSLKYQDRL